MLRYNINSDTMTVDQGLHDGVIISTTFSMSDHPIKG